MQNGIGAIRWVRRATFRKNYMRKSVRTLEQLERLIRRIDWATLRFDSEEVITVCAKQGRVTYVVPPTIWKTPDSPFRR
jgi:hypothetical protein